MLLPFRVHDVHFVTIIWPDGAAYAGRYLDFGAETAIQVRRVVRAVSERVHESIRDQHIFPVVSGVCGIGGSLYLLDLRDLPSTIKTARADRMYSSSPMETTPVRTPRTNAPSE